MPEDPNPCAAWDEDLSALIDGELGPGRAAEVCAHLEACSRCSAWLGALRRVDDLLAATPLPEVSEGVRDRVLQGLAQSAEGAAQRAEGERRSRKVDAGGELRSRRPAAPPPRRRRWLGAPAIAAVAAAVALALYLALRPDAPGPAGPPVPPVAITPPEPGRPAPILPERPEAPPGDEPPPTQIVQPLPPPPLPPPPEPEVPEFVPELAAPEPLVADLEMEPVEDLAIVLFGAEQADDFDVIAHLEILERLIELEEGRG